MLLYDTYTVITFVVFFLKLKPSPEKKQVNEQLDKMDGVVEAFSVDVLKAKKLVNIGEDVRLHLHYQHNRC